MYYYYVRAAWQLRVDGQASRRRRGRSRALRWLLPSYGDGYICGPAHPQGKWSRRWVALHAQHVRVCVRHPDSSWMDACAARARARAVEYVRCPLCVVMGILGEEPAAGRSSKARRRHRRCTMMCPCRRVMYVSSGVRATPREELSMLCILYLVILEEKRESNSYLVC